MDNTTIIDQLAEAIAAHTRPTIPLSIAIWDVKAVGAYLNKTERQITERYANMRGFPRAIRLPSANGKGHPQWYAREIIEWVEKHQEKRAV